MIKNKIRSYANKSGKYLQLIFSIFISTYTSTSILFHLGILQNFTLYGKLILILIGFFPIFWLIRIFFLTFQNRRSIPFIVILALFSLGYSALFFISNSYRQIVPVKTHTITITYPKDKNGEIGPLFYIQRIEISNSITRPIKPSKFRLIEFAISPYDAKWFYPGSILKTIFQYSGSLSIYPSTTSCPLYVKIESDGRSWIQDLCEVDSKNGIVIGFDDSGTSTDKWELFIKLVNILDFVILPLVIFVTVFTLTSLCFPNKNSPREKLFHDHLSVFYLFLDSLILFVFLILTILSTDFTWIPGFIPFAILLILDIFFKSNNKIRITKVILDFGFPVILLLVTILNFIGGKELITYVWPPMTSIDNTSDRSLNLIVNRVFGQSGQALMFGYDNVLFDRKLILPPSDKLAGFNVTVQELRRVNFKGIEYETYVSEISADQFEKILMMKHNEWTEKNGNHLILLDISYFQGNEPIKFLTFGINYIFVPNSLQISSLSEKND